MSSFDDFVDGSTPRRRSPRGGRAPLTAFELSLAEANRRATSGDWDGARGASLVGLYALCHRLVYGVLPDELAEARPFAEAQRAAARVLHESFGDNVSAAVLFVRWTWEREKKRDAWARANQKDRNRLGWRFQFSAAMVTDYRVAMRGRL